MTKTTRFADVILPTSLYIESGGVFTRLDGKAHFAAYRVKAETCHLEDYRFYAFESRYREWIRKIFLKGRTSPKVIG